MWDNLKQANMGIKGGRERGRVGKREQQTGKIFTEITPTFFQISNKFPSNANAPGSRTTFGEPLAYSLAQNLMMPDGGRTWTLVFLSPKLGTVAARPPSQRAGVSDQHAGAASESQGVKDPGRLKLPSWDWH